MDTLIAKLLENGIFLSKEGEKLNIEFNSDTIADELLEEIKNNKAALLDYLGRTRTTSNYEDISPVTSPGPYELSSAQRRLWVLSQFNEGTTAYSILGSSILNQNINIENFKKAIGATIERHEILRTVFREEKGENGKTEVKQWVLKSEELGFQIDYQDFVEDIEAESKVERYLTEDSNQDFDLENGPLMRVTLIQIEKGVYLFYYNMHHIISDGWSMEVLSKDIFAFYEALNTNSEPDLKKLRIQYKDYSAWQLGQFQKDSYQKQRAYWLEKLAGELEPLNLPSSKIRPRAKTNNGLELSTYLDAQTTKRLKDFSKANSGSMFTVVLAACNVLMYRYTGQEDLVFGTAVAGRDHADLKEQIGFYINTLALRNYVNPDARFPEFYNDVKKNTLESYSHQAYPFDQLIDELDVQRDMSRSPIFDISITYHNISNAAEIVGLNEDSVQGIKELGRPKVKFDIELHFQEVGDFLSFKLIYNQDVYDRDVIENLMLHYKQLTKILLQNPDTKISKIDFLSPNEKEKLRFDFNDTKTDYPHDSSIIALFEKQTVKTPYHIAYRHGTLELTYKELNEQSNQLADCLIKNQEVAQGDLVGMQLEPGLWVMVTILGILKTGAAYIPIDPANPNSLKEQMIADAGLKLLITDTNALVDIDFFEGEIFAIDVEFEPSLYNSNFVLPAVNAKDLAYVMYTSGSTGIPKGVMVEHRSVVRLVKNTNFYSFTESDKLLATGAISFDASTFEFWGPLLNGGQLITSSPKTLLDPALLRQEIIENSINIMWFTAGFLNQLIESDIEVFDKLKTVVAGGDKLSSSAVSKLRNTYPDLEIINGYGPTENTTFSLTYNISTITGNIPIGKPISNSQVYILSDKNQLQPIGITGEICLAGDGLARGYLNRSELTQEKFIENPFIKGQRLYKTGDLGRWLPDGNVEFIGRKDDQVKIRGYRIELGEIEHALLQLNEIVEAVVLANSNEKSGVKEIVAYITAKEVQNMAALRSELKAVLPEYMLPSYFVQLDEFPLTTNGKVDRKALPNPEGLGLTSGVAYVAPSNDLEQTIVEIWEEVLQRSEIGVNDDFFALGGHSLKALRLSNEYHKKLGVKLGLKDLFAQTNIAAHAELVNSAKSELFIQIPAKTETEIEEGNRHGYAISDAQKRLWVLSQFEGGSVAYNIPGSTYLNKEIEIKNFKKAINATIDRHEILRTVFKKDLSDNSSDLEIRQWVLSSQELGFQIDHQDFRTSENKDEKVAAYIANDSNKVFDLENGPLMRAALLQLEDDEHIFFFNMHHIISDGWSMEVLFKDVFTFYEAYQENKVPDTVPLRIQYKDYAGWQLSLSRQASFEGHQAFWLDSLSGELPLLDLPSDKKRPKLSTYNGHSLSTYIDPVITNKLKQHLQKLGGSLYIDLLATWNVLLYRYTAQSEIIIGTSVSGREHADLDDQIGFYVNTLAFKNKIDPLECFETFYQRVKNNTLKCYDHQIYPFDHLIEDLDLQRDGNRNAVFDVILLLQNSGEKLAGPKLSGEEFEEIADQGVVASKFDIEITFQEIDDYLSFKIIYNTDVYEKEMIEGLMQHYRQLLNAISENPETNIASINFLSGEEKDGIMSDINDTAITQPTEKTIIDLFENQVRVSPNQIAIRNKDKVLTYQELDELTNQLANCLIQDYGVKPLDLVGINLENKELAILSIFAVLKTGAAYVPIDPDYPEARRRYMISDSQIDVLMTETNFQFENEDFEGKLFVIDLLFEKDDFSNDAINRNPAVKDLAYVIYTSGSTGKPKGVMVGHDSLLNYLSWSKSYYINGMEQMDFGLFTSLSFDLTVTSIYLPLISGNELRIFDPNLEIDEVLSIYFQSDLRAIKLTPAHISLLGNLQLDQTNIALAIIGGDVLDKKHVAILKGLNPAMKIYNEYGPTESTVGCIVKDIKSVDDEIEIGKPIANTQVYLLSEQEVLQPIGVVGEICLAGNGLAKGYLNKEILTNEKFIENHGLTDSRLYKTGDLGRLLSNGNIVFMGRKDDQIKIRGYRIELGDIAQSLIQNEAINEAELIAKSSTSGEKELVAYFTAKKELSESDLRKHLKFLLPEYMVPSHYVQLDKFPLTRNGKIDKKALPEPDFLSLNTGIEYVAPENEIEQKLVNIWEEVLQKERIGVKDDFFILGGHSLKAVRLSNEYQKQFGAQLTLTDLFELSTVEGHLSLIQSATKTTFIEIEKLDESESYPISDAQRRLWILSQFEAGSIAYNIPGSTYLNQDIDIACFQKAIDATIDRHEILRTVFKEQQVSSENGESELRQWVLNRHELGFKIDVVDFSNEPNTSQAVQAYIDADFHKPFDLENGPLLRASLLQVDANGYVFYYNMHHIISDGWSMEVLFKDVVAHYGAYQANEQPLLEELRIQYKDYSAWQLKQLEEESFSEHRAFWLENLAGDLPLLDLPGSKQRPRIKTYNGNGLSAFLDQETTKKLKVYSQVNGGSLFMTLLATWNVLIHRYTSQNDIVIGTPVAGRNHADLENQIGFYINTLALRNKIDSVKSFNDFYQILSKNTLESFNHQMYPFDRLVEELNLPRYTSRSAIFDMMLSLQNNGENEGGIDLSETELNAINDSGASTSKFDLSVTFEEVGNYLSLNLVYNSDVYEAELMKRLVGHYKQLLSVLLESPEKVISEVVYLTEAEENEVCFTFNDSKKDLPKKHSIIKLFEEQVEKTPDNNALIFNDQTLTYRSLNDKANQFAHYLGENYKIQSNDLVGIELERSDWLIVVILGVLKSGGAYVPIDHTYPAERIDYIRQDIKAKTWINENEIEKFEETQANYQSVNPNVVQKASDLAYIIYTSGTTGKPKGVMIEAQSLTNYIFHQSAYFNLNADERFVLFSNQSFDASVEQIFMPLINGAQLFIPNQETILNVDGFLDYCNQNGITHLHAVPSYLNKLNLQDDLTFKRVVSAGELFNHKVWNLLKGRVDVYNKYGPTEGTISATIFQLNTNIDYKKSVPIGKPMSNTTVLILDEFGNLQPIGVAGEICIGGTGIARGYLNQPDLTQGKFVANPFVTNEKIYKTGDLGKWLPDGNIEYIGREDDQVKIRGYRIELGEIEHALLAHDEIHEVLVLAKSNVDGVKDLVAYIVGITEQNLTDLRSYLKGILPEYMIPVHFVQLEEFPLTKNGKIDKKSLPSPEGLALSSGVDYVAPRNEIEEKIVEIWEMVLQREEIGINDDFFDLGGYSMRALGLVAEYSKSFSVKITLQEIYDRTKLKEHAELVEVRKWIKEDPEEKGLAADTIETFEF